MKALVRWFMLVEVSCDVFRNRTILFHSGLNVILGDEEGANSIGKSSLLLVIDFVYGGNSLLEHGGDIIHELGHHVYRYRFKVEGCEYRFSRRTDSPNTVSLCDSNYGVYKDIDVKEYTEKLKRMYSLDDLSVSFRDLVGLYSRIWGKKNLDVNKPLHVVPQKSAEASIDILIKAFGLYGDIGELARQMKHLKKQKKAYNDAYSQGLMHKVGKREYRRNENVVQESLKQLRVIKEELNKHMLNVSEVIDPVLLDLKYSKDELLDKRMALENQMRRVQRNIDGASGVSTKGFHDIEDYFEHVNMERLNKVEEFHRKIVRILRNEFRRSVSELEQSLNEINIQIDQIDSEMSTYLEGLTEPSSVVDRIMALGNAVEVARKQNDHYDNLVNIDSDIKRVGQLHMAQMKKVLEQIQDTLNGRMKSLIEDGFGVLRKSPRIELDPKSYTFNVYEDTGTGTAYTSLVVFDISMLLETKVPIVIHDTVMFKNIENDAMLPLMKMYQGTDKQSFVAIDEVAKYGESCDSMLHELSVVQLSVDATLYIKNWRSV